jgi:hypothetical protein
MLIQPTYKTEFERPAGSIDFIDGIIVGIYFIVIIVPLG